MWCIYGQTQFVGIIIVPFYFTVMHLLTVWKYLNIIKNYIGHWVYAVSEHCPYTGYYYMLIILSVWTQSSHKTNGTRSCILLYWIKIQHVLQWSFTELSINTRISNNWTKWRSCAITDNSQPPTNDEENKHMYELQKTVGYISPCMVK